MPLEPALGLGFHVAHLGQQRLAAQGAQFVDAVVVIDAHSRRADALGHVEAHELHGHALGEIVQAGAELLGLAPRGTGKCHFSGNHKGPFCRFSSV